MVDDQHHHLVDVINQFGEMLMRPQGSTEQELEGVFDELARYAERHFREEEALMVSSALDKRHIDHHKQQHEQFLQDVTHLHAGVATGKREDAINLRNFLTNWLAYHILGSDQLMAWLMAASVAGKSQEDAYHSYMASKDPATATLLKAMNGLFNQVSERNRELYELNLTLEARVAERTRALFAANERLENMAMTDVLTSLPNRRHAMLAFEAEWQKSQATGAPLSCMMIDADGFKGINDTYGHDAGDVVLRQLARMLREAVRTDDIVCRLGGDEFFVICANTPLGGALQTAEKVRSDVASMRVVAGEGIWQGSISVGVAVAGASMNGIEELLKCADQGVYLAKRNGRNRVATVCSP
jgi:hemerythrin